MCVSARLRLAERRLQRLQEVQAKRELLRGELAETQGRLMLEPGRWLEQCESSSPAQGPRTASPAQHPGPTISPQAQGAAGYPEAGRGRGDASAPRGPGPDQLSAPPDPCSRGGPGAGARVG